MPLGRVGTDARRVTNGLREPRRGRRGQAVSEVDWTDLKVWFFASRSISSLVQKAGENQRFFLDPVSHDRQEEDGEDWLARKCSHCTWQMYHK